MGQVTQNSEQHVLINVIPFGKVFGKGIISKTMTIQKHRNLTKNSQRKHDNSLSFIIVILQHIPIAMITKTCNRKQSCCTVTYCPLVTAWATTIH
jgi:hypothetical protein